VRAQPLENQAAVSAASKGCIDVATLCRFESARIAKASTASCRQYRLCASCAATASAILQPQCRSQSKIFHPRRQLRLRRQLLQLFFPRCPDSRSRNGAWRPASPILEAGEAAQFGEISTRQAASISTSSAKPTSRRFHTEKRASSAGKPITRARIGPSARRIEQQATIGVGVSTRLDAAGRTSPVARRDGAKHRQASFGIEA